MKFTEIKQKANPGLGIHDNNKKVCPGFSYSDSISWITNQPERYELFAKTLIDNFPKAKTWLELGCGPGCLSYYIKEHGDNINYVTLDINKDAPQQSKYIDNDNHFLCFTDREYQIQSNNEDVKFDMIISYEHFEYIPPANLSTFLNNIKNHCHKDTIINCTSSTQETSGEKILDSDEDYRHVSIRGFASHQAVFTREKWKEILEEHGFELLENTYLNSNNCPPNFVLPHTIELTFKLK